MEMFLVAGHQVDPSLNRVTLAGGATVQVEPKVMSVLVALAERQGEVVTRDELMLRVWPGVHVTDDALHRTIRELRRLFADDAEAPRVIETIRKRGYRLIATVELAGDSPGVRPRDRIGVGPRARLGVGPGDRLGDRLGVRPRVRPLTSWIAAGVVMVVGIVAITRFTLQIGATRAHPLAVTFAPLTSDPGNEVDPALSPSGRLAYVARGADGRAHIFTKATGDAAAVQITTGPGSEHAPVWSPDEETIAFVQLTDTGCHIVVSAATGARPRTLSPCLSREEWKMSWSRDGRHLAVTAGDARLSSPSHIETIAIADGSRETITHPPAGHAGDYSPAYSPDGRSIAFVRAASGGVTALHTARLDDRSEGAVWSDGTDILGVDWSADGRFLIFSSDRGGAIGIWQISSAPLSAAQRSAPELVAGGGAKLKHPTVALRTGAVAYEDWQYEINLREQPTTPDDRTHGAHPLGATSDRWNFHPQVSPDGSHLIFQSTRSGQYELWLSDRDGANPRRLTASLEYKSAPRWSPDSRHVAYTIRGREPIDETAGNGTALCVLDTVTGQSRQFAQRDTAPVALTGWTHDGSRVYVSGPVGERFQIQTVEVATGRAQFVRDDAYGAAESTDGRWLYFGRLDRAGLWRIPVGGGSETPVTPRTTGEQWANWGTFDRGLFYVDYPDEGEPQLFTIEEGAAAPRPMARLDALAWAGVTLSRDGSRVVYAHADRRSSNIGSLVAR